MTPSFDWVWFSFVAWRGRTNRCHHLVRELAPRHRVLWIDPPDTGVEPAPPEPVAPGVWRLQPPGIAASSALGQMRWEKAFRPTLEAWRRPDVPCVVFVQFPELFQAAITLPADLRVYDALDDWRHAAGGPSVRVEVAERMLARRAELVVAVSERVETKFKGLGAETLLVRNGCRVEDWRDVERAEPVPELRDAPWPRLLFTGLIDENVDVAVVEGAAKALPDASWFFVGPCRDEAVGDALKKLPRVRLLGTRPYEELPRWLAGADACVLPFTASAFNYARDSLKLYEYLAAGKPVAATALPQTMRFADVIQVGHPERRVEGFAAACGAALQDVHPARRALRLAVAAANPWSARAAQLEATVAQRLAARPSER